MHQDNAFLHTDPPSVIGLWCALEDATITNGCLRAIVRSQSLLLFFFVSVIVSGLDFAIAGRSGSMSAVIRIRDLLVCLCLCASLHSRDLIKVSLAISKLATSVEECWTVFVSILAMIYVTVSVAILAIFY
jgi:hypothetical protein